MTYENTDGYKIRNQAATHFLTFTISGWIDVFSRKIYRDIILDSFKYCQQQKGLNIHAWVIMSNHIHTIWSAKNGNLSDIIRDFKTFTSKAITKAIQQEPESRKEWLIYMFQFFANQNNANKYFKVWKPNSHPEEIYSEHFLLSKLNYIHQNPVRAGIVTESTHYLYSSASDYEGKKGLIDLDLLF